LKWVSRHPTGVGESFTLLVTVDERSPEASSLREDRE